MPDDIATFPLSFDATDAERAQAREAIAKHARIVGEEPGGIRFAGSAIGQTGPIWHFQYLRMYRLPKGFLVAGRDLREGVKVGYAETAVGLPGCFEQEVVREFVEDELRFRGAIGAEEPAGA